MIAWYRPEREPAPAEEELEAIFMDAVAKRMIADVPLAAFLSGGLDSSLVVAAMSRISSRPVHTFSVTFAGPSTLDESPYARLVAQHCRTDHQEVVLDSAALREALPEVLQHLEEPFGDASVVPMYLVSRAARKQFTVALSGDGADEVFAGYRKYRLEYYLKRLGPYPLRRWLWRPLSALLPTGRTSRLLEFNRRVRRILKSDAPTAAERHVNMLHMSMVCDEALLGSRLARIGFSPLRELLLARLGDNPDLNRCLLFDQNLVLRDDMFVKVDRMSMKASLEVRSPFVDHRLVALANGLPAERKLRDGQGKRVLVERLGHLLPAAILDRPKTGFEMPLGAWLRQDLASWTEDRLFHHADTRDWVDKEGLKRVWDMHRKGRQDCTEVLWYHIVFASWLKRFYG
jgi:asparagine synthase (glutamine-hydrolysing)